MANGNGVPAENAGEKRSSPGVELHLEWAEGIELGEWSVYVRAIKALRGAGLPFMLGGGWALAAFTGRWRNTKDIDLYIRPQDRERAVQALQAQGFLDYHERLAYDRRWIYRGFSHGVIVDAIWSMANFRSAVEDAWFARASTVTIRGETLQIMPVEEFAWCKLYILQRDRCDWTDIFNILAVNGDRIDWAHFIDRVGPDLPLLRGLLSVYGWVHPERAARLPGELWPQFGLPAPETGPVNWEARARYLDSRAWFSPLRKRGETLEI